MKNYAKKPVFQRRDLTTIISTKIPPTKAEHQGEQYRHRQTLPRRLARQHIMRSAENALARDPAAVKHLSQQGGRQLSCPGHSGPCSRTSSANPTSAADG